jgi:hypothetical protein
MVGCSPHGGGAGTLHPGGAHAARVLERHGMPVMVPHGPVFIARARHSFSG